MECPNLSHPDNKLVIDRLGENAFWSIWNQNNGIIPEFILTQLRNDVKSSNIKLGVEELFNENPELASIGIQEQYSQYLSTIFPDSKVKDIVYHGTEVEFENFDFNKEGKRNKGQGLYFSVFKKAAENYGKRIIPVLLNSKNVKEINITRGQNYGDVGRVFRSPYYDTVYGFSDLNKNREFSDIYNSEYVVFEPEQIHILGSKQDIENFAKFVKNSELGNVRDMENYMDSKSVDYIMSKLIQSGKIEKRC